MIDKINRINRINRIKSNPNRMPALIGGFGKINRNIIKRYSSLSLSLVKESNEESELRSKIGAYLAGTAQSHTNLSLVV